MLQLEQDIRKIDLEDRNILGNGHLGSTPNSGAYNSIFTNLFGSHLNSTLGPNPTSQNNQAMAANKATMQQWSYKNDKKFMKNVSVQSICPIYDSNVYG